MEWKATVVFSLIAAALAQGQHVEDEKRGEVSSEDKQLTIFTYNVTGGAVLRLRVSSKNASLNAPILTVVREIRAVVSWPVPLTLQPNFTQMGAARTLCPYPDQTSGKVTVELSTASPKPVDYNLIATFLDPGQFDLKFNKSLALNSTASGPYYVRFRMPKDKSSVLVVVQGYDDICMVVSIQPISCPVYDLDTNVHFTGVYQTMTRKAAIPITKKEYSEFYIVFVVKADSKDCTGMSSIIPPDPIPETKKDFEVTVAPALSETDFELAVGVTAAIIAGIYFLAIVLSCVFSKIDEKERKENEERILGRQGREEAEPLHSPVAAPLGYGTLDGTVSSNLAGSSRDRRSRESSRRGSINGVTATVSSEPGPEIQPDEGPQPPEEQPLTQSDQLIREEYDTLDDAVLEKAVVRAKAKLCVKDLAMKPWKQRDKKYRTYHWNLLTISVFYVLPVIQLVLAYQAVVTNTGNLEICYYNFLCARPFIGLFAFNNVFSNIGYIMLGFLFLILVKNRDAFHKRQMERHPELELDYGLPRHYGLFYAMGISLVMEGVLSGCYHVCPNYSNFQFDTAFMYMIGALGMLKIYQIRHPDINANSHIAYAVMALVILLSVIGVVANGLVFWIVFSIFYLLLLIALSAEFYYKGEWHLDRRFYQRLQQDWRASFGPAWYKPLYPDRVVFLIIGNMLNIAFVVLGLVNRPKDFGSFMLAVFIANLLLYTVYYIAMKIRHGERLKYRPIVYILLSLVTWSAALYFFFSANTDWTVTPAQSRDKNRACILLDFYDSHDIWHFLSALSLFLSFLILLNIDDDLDYVHQKTIAVF